MNEISQIQLTIMMLCPRYMTRLEQCLGSWQLAVGTFRCTGEDTHAPSHNFNGVHSLYLQRRTFLHPRPLAVRSIFLPLCFYFSSFSHPCNSCLVGMFPSPYHASNSILVGT